MNENEGSHSAARLRSVGFACARTTCVPILLAFAACDTLGRVHVSQPEVHTRERLVAERAVHDELRHGPLSDVPGRAAADYPDEADHV